MPTDDHDDHLQHVASDDGMPHPVDKAAQDTVEHLSTQELWKRATDKRIEVRGAARSEHPLDVFLRDVAAELVRAQAKFPGTDNVAVALMEEVGELAKAMLDEHPHNIYKEAVQVAAMAARCSLEGDPTIDAYRARSRSDGTRAVGIRP